ncbi:MAG TPA: aminotransferase class IV [Opitutaceae bacterium]|nr:aminotransferase class IV [Opitutaceae bacterium]
MYIQANTNGRLHSAAEPSLSPLDRGFLYGDAVYEVWRTYHGVLFAWDEHWERLGRSARALSLRIPFAPEALQAEIRRTVAAYRAGGGGGDDLYIRLQLTRGSGAIGLDIALAGEPSFVLLVQPCPRLSAEHLARGQRLSVARGLRRNPVDALDPAWKTGNYLNNLLCLREAKERGADEVVILNQAGEVTEAAVSNIAFVREGRLLTPPLSAGILSGVTRRLVLGGVAAEAGLEVVESAVRPEAFASCQECMLLSTTKDVVPVAAIDGAAFRVAPDTASMRLKAAFAAFARRYAELHSGWRVA